MAEYEGQFGLANKAIAAVSDPVTREALLASRSEFYTVMRDLNMRDDTVRDMANAVTQSAQSTARVVSDLAQTVKDHLEADASFQERVGEQFSSAKNWLIGTLVTMTGSLLIALTIVLFQNGLPGHH